MLAATRRVWTPNIRPESRCSMKSRKTQSASRNNKTSRRVRTPSKLQILHNLKEANAKRIEQMLLLRKKSSERQPLRKKRRKKNKPEWTK